MIDGMKCSWIVLVAGSEMVYVEGEVYRLVRSRHMVMFVDGLYYGQAVSGHNMHSHWERQIEKCGVVNGGSMIVDF